MVVRSELEILAYQVCDNEMRYVRNSWFNQDSIISLNKSYLESFNEKVSSIIKNTFIYEGILWLFIKFSLFGIVLCSLFVTKESPIQFSYI